MLKPWQKGSKKIDNGDSDTTLRQLTEVIDENSSLETSLLAHYHRSRLHLARDNQMAALRDLDTILRLTTPTIEISSNTYLLEYRIQALVDKARIFTENHVSSNIFYNQAIQHARSLYKLDKNYAILLINLFMAKSNSNFESDPQIALDSLTKALLTIDKVQTNSELSSDSKKELSGLNRTASFNYGTANWSRRKYFKAEKAFLRLGQYEGNLVIADYYFKKGEFKKFKKHLAKALSCPAVYSDDTISQILTPLLVHLTLFSDSSKTLNCEN